MTETSRPLRILSLAGGGCRALTSLYILDRVMKELATFLGKEGQDLRPCDYFDLIGGTSAGGIVAIMLGRLRMTVPECIPVFSCLSKRIFKDGKSRFRIWNRYKISSLIAAVKEVLQNQGMNEDEHLRVSESSGDHCRTFVTAVRTDRLTENKQPVVFSSYPPLCPDPDLQQVLEGATIWQAIRAITAYPGVSFEPIIIGGIEFIDAAAGNFNNPGFVVERQAKEIWPERKIDVFLSLGTGERTSIELRPKSFVRNIWKLGKAIKNVATGGVIITDKLEKELTLDVFYHFDVDSGLGDIKLTAWRMLEKFEALTKTYLEKKETTRRIEDLVHRIAKLPLDLEEFKRLSAPETPEKVKVANFPCIAQNHPRVYEWVVKAFEAHIEAVESFKRFLSCKDKKTFDAWLAMGSLHRYFNFSDAGLTKALEAISSSEDFKEAYPEIKVLFSKRIQVLDDYKSFPSLDEDRVNRINAEILDQRLREMNPTSTHSVECPNRVRTLQRVKGMSRKPCRCIDIDNLRQINQV